MPVRTAKCGTRKMTIADERNNERRRQVRTTKCGTSETTIADKRDNEKATSEDNEMWDK